MIRIAIDCRPLVTKRTGIGRYLYEILRELASRTDEIEYYLYAPREIDVPVECLTDSRFRIVVRRFRPAIAWLHLIVPVCIWRDKIDVFWGPNYAMPLIKALACRYVITIHDVVHIKFPNTMLWKTRLHNALMLPLYSTFSDGVLTDSACSKRDLVKCLRIPERKIKLVPLASASDGARLPDGQGFDGQWGDVDFILSVGTIEPRKNLRLLVHAYSMMPVEIRQRYRLVLAGGIGWGGENPVKWISDYGVENEVFYLGRVTDEELDYMYRHTQLFVFPSLYEGFGLPVLEAMSRGAPVLVSNASALPEVAGQAAIYFDPRSVQDLCGKMTAALSDSKLRDKMSRQSVRRAELFSWSATAHETLKLLLGEDGSQ